MTTEQLQCRMISVYPRSKMNVMQSADIKPKKVIVARTIYFISSVWTSVINVGVARSAVAKMTIVVTSTHDM